MPLRCELLSIPVRKSKIRRNSPQRAQMPLKRQQEEHKKNFFIKKFLVLESTLESANFKLENL